MLPSSHPFPRNAAGHKVHEPSLALTDAFSEFISASSVLECSYRNLQREVGRLGVELAERNTALAASLAENERMRAALQQMIDSLPCGVLVMNELQEIVMANPAARNLLDMGSRTVRNVGELSHVCGVDVLEIVGNEEPGTETDVCLHRRNGDRWLAITKQQIDGPARGDEMCRLQTVWILRDITTTREAELQREANRNAMALAEVATVLAHEIRNPLASMELFAGLMVNQPEQGMQWTENLLAGIRLLTGTVNNVLSMHSGVSPVLRPIDVTECVGHAIEFARPIANQAGVCLCFERRGHSIRSTGNAEAVQQIMLNLIRNGIRHTPVGGCIRVSTDLKCEVGRHRAVVQVADTGSGIAPDLLDRIFEPGVSGDGGSPGLGLAVCSRLMSQLGGRISVVSTSNRGTTFELELPVYED